MTKVNVTSPLKDLFGKTIKMEGDNPMTVGLALCACLSNKKAETIEDTIADYALIQRINNVTANTVNLDPESENYGIINLSPQEASRAQKAVQASQFTTMVAGPLLLLLEANKETSK